MQQCPNCGHKNRAGIVFCENCGASLIGKSPISTKSLEEEQAQAGVDTSVLTDVRIQGTAVFEEGSSLRLEIEGSPESIVLKPKPETIFGRRDPATGAMPDVDLTPFAGYRMGVSRRHSAIRFGEDQNLALWDLGSSNGTFLNGQRLSAHRPYRLHDGDEIRLGQMVIRVFFQPAEKPEAVPKAEAPAPARPEAVQPAPAETKALEEPPAVTEGKQAAPEAAAPSAPASKPDAPKPPVTDKITAKPPAPGSAAPDTEQKKDEAPATAAPPPEEKPASPEENSTEEPAPPSEPKPAVEAAKPEVASDPASALPEPPRTEGSPPSQAAASPPKPPEGEEKSD